MGTRGSPIKRCLHSEATCTQEAGLQLGHTPCSRMQAGPGDPSSSATPSSLPQGLQFITVHLLVSAFGRTWANSPLRRESSSLPAEGGGGWWWGGEGGRCRRDGTHLLVPHEQGKGSLTFDQSLPFRRVPVGSSAQTQFARHRPSFTSPADAVPPWKTREPKSAVPDGGLRPGADSRWSLGRVRVPRPGRPSTVAPSFPLVGGRAGPCSTPHTPSFLEEGT